MSLAFNGISCPPCTISELSQPGLLGRRNRKCVYQGMNPSAVTFDSMYKKHASDELSAANSWAVSVLGKLIEYFTQVEVGRTLAFNVLDEYRIWA